jgi:repressor LexA
MAEASKRQLEIFEFIRGFIEEHDYSPSMREIGAHFGISVRAVYELVSKLREKGYLNIEKTRHRSIGLGASEPAKGSECRTRFYEVAEVPILGDVAAGAPSPDEGSFEGWALVPRASLTKAPIKNFFALRVRGDSMQDEGILSGDLAIIESRNDIKNGEIAAVWISDEGSDDGREGPVLKRFFRDKGRIRLESANSAYRPRYVTNVHVMGRLVYVSRAYH